MTSLCCHDVSFKPVGGAPPVLQLLNKDNQVLEQFELDKKSREDCNQLLYVLGFLKKSDKDTVIDEEQRNNLVYRTTKQLEKIAESGDTGLDEDNNADDDDDDDDDAILDELERDEL